MRRSIHTPGAAAHSRAFSWYLPQPITIGISALLGAFSGWTFRHGRLDVAWMLFLFSFVWVLVMSLFLGLWLAYRTRIARGDLRAALHTGYASVFPLTTAYLALVAVVTLSIPLVPVNLPGDMQALSRPDFLRQIPIFYVCSLIVGTISGPLYARTVPISRANTRPAVPDRSSNAASPAEQQTPREEEVAYDRAN